METMQETTETTNVTTQKSAKAIKMAENKAIKEAAELSRKAKHEWAATSREAKTKEDALKMIIAKHSFMTRQRASAIKFAAEREVKELTNAPKPTQEDWDMAQSIGKAKTKLYLEEIGILEEIMEKVK